MPAMLGQAPAMQDVFRAIGRLSQSNVTVLITGESGSGKELVARALHKHSPRGDAGVEHVHGRSPCGADERWVAAASSASTSASSSACCSEESAVPLSRAERHAPINVRR